MEGSDARSSGSEEREAEDVEARIEELVARAGIKDNHIRELYEKLSEQQIATEEAVSEQEAARESVEVLRRERGRLRERISTLEEDLRDRRRGRESQDRKVERLQRDLERREDELSRRDRLIKRREDEMETLIFETDTLVARKEGALDDAMRRVAGLERDLEERENDVSEMRKTVEELRGRLEDEQGARERLADPANRLRSGIDLFNDSSHRESMNALSRSLGQPHVHVRLEEGVEPRAILTFTWQGVTWQRYAANPGLAVEEPRVYLDGSGEDLSGVSEDPPNARVGPGGKVLLGL